MIFMLLAVRNVKHTNLADFSDVDIEIPKSYNFLEEYPECDFGPLVQSCGCCYAMTPLKSLAHRFCRATRKMLVLSHQFMVSCDLFNLGCDGGNEKSVFYFLEQHGVPDVDCQPWQNIRIYNPNVCKKCISNKGMKFYRSKRGSTKHYLGIDNIKKGLMLEGPMSASLVSDENFIWYKNGLYSSAIDSSPYTDQSNHTVEIHGWGEFENGTQYWLVQNAFGTTWGQNGLMKMKLGTNEGYVESYMIAALPDLDNI